MHGEPGSPEQKDAKKTRRSNWKESWKNQQRSSNLKMISSRPS